jgi:uncharacterized protein with GYD domain
MLLILNLPHDDATAKFALNLGMLGNVRTTTLKAFSEKPWRSIIGPLS